ncbi:MAG: YfcE family phosphodiesterase [Candidatus Staskawiczbacteria bacterium]|nr:YfcE family phosphodiesterase [Candidatus Staskawiczbacteria bacterium]
MKIAIVSDTHNNWNNFKKAIEWIKKEKIQMILHCGDICSQEIVDDSKKLFGGEIKFVKGNGDYDLDLPEKMELEFELESPSTSSGRLSLKVAFTHFPDIAKKMAQQQDPSRASGQAFDLVFYGHTHRPWDEKINNCHMINPGELAGQFYKSTFAIYDTSTESLELKILEQL